MNRQPTAQGVPLAELFAALALIALAASAWMAIKFEGRPLQLFTAHPVNAAAPQSEATAIPALRTLGNEPSTMDVVEAAAARKDAAVQTWSEIVEQHGSNPASEPPSACQETAHSTVPDIRRSVDG